MGQYYHPIILGDNRKSIASYVVTETDPITKEKKQRVCDMIRVFFDKYGEQIQFNVVGNKVYREAQKMPEKYKDLMVRVSGYSALFVSLAKDVQEDVISRNELDL